MHRLLVHSRVEYRTPNIAYLPKGFGGDLGSTGYIFLVGLLPWVFEWPVVTRVHTSRKRTLSLVFSRELGPALPQLVGFRCPSLSLSAKKE